LNRRFLGVIALTLAAVSAFAQASIIKEIVVRGNQRVLSDVIQLAMRTKVGQPYIQDNLDKDQQSIEDLGYFSAVSVRANPLDAGNYSVTVDVVEFPVVKEIRVTGNTSVKTEDILAVVPLKPGQVYNLKTQKATSDAVRALYANKGLYAQVEEFRPLDASPGTINLAILELKVGKVAVQGNVHTKDWVLARLIKTKSGESFNGNRWTDDLRRLYNTGWFEPGSLKSVEDTESELGKIDLTVQLKEARTGQFNIGLQLDPQSSLAGVIKLSETNLGGTGKSVGLDFTQTTRGGGASVSLDYSNPFYDRKDTVFNASVYTRQIYRFTGTFGSSSNNTDYRERRTGASMGFTRMVKDKLSLGISGRIENVGTGSIPRVTNDNGTPNDPSDDFLQPDPRYIQQDGDLGVLSFGGTLNRRDLDLDASRGDYTRFDIEPGYAHITKANGVPNQDILGRNYFLRTTLEYRRYFSDQPARTRQDADAPRRVLAMRARIDNISGNVPFFEQYFAGGSDSIRGYDEDRFWGKQTLLTTAEYRYPLQRSFNAIAFVDYGGAWGGYGTVNKFDQSDKFNLHVGYGLGLSFRTPLGPIRLDLGFDDRGKSRTHFLIGTSF
jgi:outer membrane protein insertion porin family